MNTDDLIASLATGAGPVPAAPALRRLVPAIALTLLVSAGASVALLGLIPPAMWSGPAPWIKLGYAGALCAACAWLAARLARPGLPVSLAALAPPLVFVTMALAGIAAYAGVPEGQRMAYLVGKSSLRCPWLILLLSLPALGGMLWALRGLAPTRPAIAGLAAGLTAGAIGAAGYALSCTEESIAFVAIWYSLGIALSGLAGAALGSRVLRW